LQPEVLFDELMGEKEPRSEIIKPGELFFLSHPGSEYIFSAYGLTLQPDRKEYIAGLLIIDRPKPANPEWLKKVEDTFGECNFAPMVTSGERGIFCRMQIEPDSRKFMRRYASIDTSGLKTALEPLISQIPKPLFSMQWNEDKGLWQSEIVPPNELPTEIKELFEKIGYGCLALEADIGIVHVCHASDTEIEGFANKPVTSRWQLIKMPTAPLIRLEVKIFDQPENPYRFESFLNVAEQDQEKVLAELANQNRLFLAFYGEDLGYRYTKVIPHDIQNWQKIDEMTIEAINYLSKIPPNQQDFDKAKAEFTKTHF
jgi:hypothetical protein